MTSRELITRLISGKPVERCGFWLGNPQPQTWPILHRYFGTNSEQHLRLNHNVADLFGMENYFVKMYECPRSCICD